MPTKNAQTVDFSLGRMHELKRNKHDSTFVVFGAVIFFLFLSRTVFAFYSFQLDNLLGSKTVVVACLVFIT